MRHQVQVTALVGAVAATLTALAARADTLATGTPADKLTLTTHVMGLSQPTDFAFLPDGRIVMTEKGGAAKVRKTDGTVVTAGMFSVSTTSEQGLLGVAVDPAFASTRRLFFYYSDAAGTAADRHRIASVTLRDDNTLDLAGRKVLVTGLRGPANHDGGSLAIGPDGKLYIGVGDTGCNSNTAPEPPYTPTNFFATCLTNGNGKILRVNLDGTIPTDNPLAAVAAATACGGCGTDIATTGTGPPRTDIWAWGFRNPWRFWFDPMTGSLWVGDVGEITYEEITIAQKGRHHGWPWREGTHGWPQAKCKDVMPDTGDCVDPIWDCKHGSGAGESGCTSITGGLIIDFCSWPAELRGHYVFGDNSNGHMWTLEVNPSRTGVVSGSRQDFATAMGPVAIHAGPDQALYWIDVVGGQLERAVPKAPLACAPDLGPEPTGGTDGGLGDGGTGDGGSQGDSGGQGDGPRGDGGDGAGSSDGGGCGCSIADPESVLGLAFGATVLVVNLLARRRRR